MERSIHVGVAQTYFDPKDVEGNLGRMLAQIKSAEPLMVHAVLKF